MRILLATGAMYPEPGGAPVVSPDAGLTAPEVASAIASTSKASSIGPSKRSASWARGLMISASIASLAVL